MLRTDSVSYRFFCVYSEVDRLKTRRVAPNFGVKMKRLISFALLATLLVVAYAGDCSAQTKMQASGFNTAITSKGDAIWGPAPYEGVLLRVTQVTSTTVFYTEVMRGLGSSFGSQTLDDFAIHEYSLKGVKCSVLENNMQRRAISAFDVSVGKWTVATAWKGLLVVGDVIALVPKARLSESISLTVKNKATITAGSATCDTLFALTGHWRIEDLSAIVDVALQNSAHNRAWVVKIPQAADSVGKYTLLSKLVSTSNKAVGIRHTCALDTLIDAEETAVDIPYYVPKLHRRTGWVGTWKIGVDTTVTVVPPASWSYQLEIFSPLTFYICDTLSAAKTGSRIHTIRATPLGGDGNMIRRWHD